MRTITKSTALPLLSEQIDPPQQEVCKPAIKKPPVEPVVCPDSGAAQSGLLAKFHVCCYLSNLSKHIRSVS